jgi:hypothetical protein
MSDFNLQIQILSEYYKNLTSHVYVFLSVHKLFSTKKGESLSILEASDP